MKTCPFCSILAGTAPASVVLSTEGELAFLDLAPVNPGHTLVIPRRHVSSLTELTSLEVGSLGQTAQRVANVMKRKLPGCVGVTLSLADGPEAGQDVPHVHFHVIPRFPSDSFGWRRGGQRSQRRELDAIAEKLRTG